MATPLAKGANYDDYQSYVEDHTQYNKEVSMLDARLMIVVELI